MPDRPELLSGDPNWSNVSLLLHCDGTNGSTTFTDSSSLALTVLATNVTISTTHPQFGTGAGNCASSTSFLNTGATTPFQFGSGQFTVEGWIYFTSFSGTSTYVFMGNFSAVASNLGWDFGWSNGSLDFFYSTAGTDNPNIGAIYTPALNTWIHIAADRDASNVLRVYANGAVVASATVAASFFPSTNSWYVGNDRNANRGLPGQFDEVRVTKGIARYGGAFTPPTAAFPTGPLGITGTLATTEATDAAAFAGTVSWAAITGTLAATEATDAAAFVGNPVTWPLITGTLGAIEAPDLAAFAGSPGLIPTITIKLGMQILVNRQSTLGYWVPAVVTGVALDQVPIVFGCWSQGPALGTSGQMGIMLNIADHGTTWVAAGGAP